MVLVNIDNTLPYSSFAEYLLGNANYVSDTTPLQTPINANGSTPSCGGYTKELSMDVLDGFSDELDGDIACRLGSLTISKNFLETNLENKSLFVKHPQLLSNKIDPDIPINSQDKSDMCWNYAGLNMMRFKLMKQYNLAEFEFSKAYLYFYDKLEKANWFLENILSTLDQSLNSRLMQCLFAKPMRDSSQWDMFVALIEKYGMVPNSAYSDTYHTDNSPDLVNILSPLVRKFALRLRNEYASGKCIEELRVEKVKMIKEVYRIMTIANLKAPKKFTWAFHDKNGTFHEFKDITPLEFYKNFMLFDCSQTVSLFNDPRNKYMHRLAVEYVGNVVGGCKISHINVPMSEIKRLAAKMVMTGHPIWFSCDVLKLTSHNATADTSIFDYKAALNLDDALTKTERLQCLESKPTHVMMLAGAHIENGKIVRWLVENSWGREFGNNDHLIITDEWFDEYVYQIIAMKTDLSQEINDAFVKDTIVLSPWDPLSIWSL